MSDTREGTFVSTSGRLITQGPPLADLLDDTASAGRGNVTVLIHYGGARADAIDRGGYRSTRLGFDFGRTPVFWLGCAPEAQSFERVQELFGQARNEKIQVLLIELASLHPTTDLVLPFLTRLVDPSNPVAIRREAAEGFDHHHDPRSVEILLRVARHRHGLGSAGRGCRDHRRSADAAVDSCPDRSGHQLARSGRSPRSGRGVRGSAARARAAGDRSG